MKNNEHIEKIETSEYTDLFAPNTDETKIKHSPCMHDNCPTCGGTGKRKDGLGSCLHMISCPCPKCNPQC